MHLLLDTSKLSLPTQCHFVIYQVFPVVWGSGLDVYVHSDLPDLVLSLLDLLLMIPASPAAMMSSAFSAAMMPSASAVMMLMTPAACDLPSPTPM